MKTAYYLVMLSVLLTASNNYTMDADQARIYSSKLGEELSKENFSFDVVFLYLRHNANINATSSTGNTVLHRIAAELNQNDLHKILKYRPNVNASNHSRSTPLILAADAADSDHEKVAVTFMTFLLAAGADVNLVNNDHISAMDLCINKDLRKCVCLLLAHAGIPGGYNYAHATPEMRALLDISLESTD